MSALPAATAAATARWVCSSRPYPVDRGGVDAPGGQLLVEQHPGAGAALPVDVTQLGPLEVVDPGEPERVAGRDDEALVAVHQPDHREVRARAEQPVQVRQRVLAGRRVQQVRAGQVAEPVPERDQAAERADVGRTPG